jgi:hypothetical protein
MKTHMVISFTNKSNSIETYLSWRKDSYAFIFLNTDIIGRSEHSHKISVDD